jgi:hypothetical protein
MSGLLKVSRDGAILQSGFGMAGGGNCGEVFSIKIDVSNAEVAISPKELA